MKKVLFSVSLFVFCLTVIPAMGAEWVTLKNPDQKTAEVKLVSSGTGITVLNLSVTGFYKVGVQTPDGMKYAIRVPGGSSLLNAGAPDLSSVSASVIIGDNAVMKVELISSSYIEYYNIDIIPSKGNLYRNIDPGTVPFLKDEVFYKDEFYPGNLTQLRDPYILRDYRGQTVVFYPFQYNPVTKTLRVMTDMTVRISEEVSKKNPVNSFLRNYRTEKSREFQAIYTNHFKNPPTVQYTLLPESGKMLVLCHGAFMSAMEPFIAWKKRKGIQIEMVDIATVGNTDTQIKAFVANYYNTNGLTFLLLVGDDNHIATPMQSPAQTGGASDPSYGFISGNDSYAEVIVGRFSAQSVADVQTQVERVLNYEMNPIPGAPFYSKGVCVASDQGPGDDNEYDWEHERIIRDDLLAFTYSDVAELYDGTHGGMDSVGDPTSADLFSLFQSGISIMNYTGHGSTNSCTTTGLSSTDVSNMTNYNMLPFIWSVACVNGEFTGGNCLAEAFLRAQSGGLPTGAIAAYMSSINQSWDPPMDGQDEMVDLLVGASANHTMRTFGGLSVNGCMHMNDEYAAAGAEMTDTWHCFGDPSLEVRTAAPVAMTVVHVASVSLGTNQLQISCTLDSALVCLTLNGEIIGTGTVIGGMAMINFSSLTFVDSIDVTVTAFNAIPYFGIVEITGGTSTVYDMTPDDLITVYPNPVMGQAVIQFNLGHEAEVTVCIYDERGRKVTMVAEKVFCSGKQTLRFDTDNLSAGKYFCRVLTGNRFYQQAFSVVR